MGPLAFLPPFCTKGNNFCDCQIASLVTLARQKGLLIKEKICSCRSKFSPLRVDPVEKDPLRVYPVEKDPFRVDPVEKDPLRVDPVEKET